MRLAVSVGSFESRLVMPDRVKAMCAHLFGQLLETGTAQQKTIIFCASDDHADAVAIEMNNLYNEWSARNGGTPILDYAFKCTAAGGKEHLSELRGSGRHHYIAATVDLLTTGVDVPALENIVFFKNVKSPIAFYQMLGRGTRLHPGKMMFRVYDYTNATRLFGRDFVQPAVRVSTEPGGPHTPQESLQVHGIDVRITNGGTFVLSKDENGKEVLLTLEAYKDGIAESLLEDIPGLDEFREVWIEPGKRHALIQRLSETRQSVDALRVLIGMEDYDLYDVLADVGYRQAPRTRIDRAETFTASNSDWLDAMPDAAARTIRAIASRFAIGGTEELENQGIFQTPAVSAREACPRSGSTAMRPRPTPRRNAGCSPREHKRNAPMTQPPKDKPLPPGWRWAKLGEVCEIKIGRTPSSWANIPRLGRYSSLPISDLTGNTSINVGRCYPMKVLAFAKNAFSRIQVPFIQALS